VPFLICLVSLQIVLSRALSKKEVQEGIAILFFTVGARYIVPFLICLVSLQIVLSRALSKKRFRDKCMERPRYDLLGSPSAVRAPFAGPAES
jgi:hypothetical protein